jgi:arsenate reductase
MATPVTIYGIKNCDTMKKARTWLDTRQIAYAFHDYKSAGVTRQLLDGWMRTCRWDELLNRAGTTFRNLPDRDKLDLAADKAAEKAAEKAVALMLDQPSIIKRPVLDVGGALTVGFKPEIYERVFSSRPL